MLVVGLLAPLKRRSWVRVLQDEESKSLTVCASLEYERGIRSFKRTGFGEIVKAVPRERELDSESVRECAGVSAVDLLR